MALSGNLGFVPLDEVLRLLTRSDQQGSVDVWGQDVRGRIFVNKKGIGLATTCDDKELRRHLVNSGYVDEAFLVSVDSGSATLAPLAEKEASIVDLLREMTVESLFQMTSKGSSFEVTESATSPYASPRAFELEAVLEESRRRSHEWAEVQKVISDLDGIIRMNRDLGEQDSVKIGRDAWRLLCEMGSGASVRSIAERLGTTDFWTAKVAAGLSEQHLLVFAESIAEEPWVAPITEEASSVEDAEATEEVDQPEPVAERVVEKVTDESWWVEPEADEAEDTTPEADTESEPEPTAGACPSRQPLRAVRSQGRGWRRPGASSSDTNRTHSPIPLQGPWLQTPVMSRLQTWRPSRKTPRPSWRRCSPSSSRTASPRKRATACSAVAGWARCSRKSLKRTESRCGGSRRH